MVNNDGYTVERAIHGAAEPYNDIPAWRWLEVPSALGFTASLSFSVHTWGELEVALEAAARNPDRMTLIEVMLRPDDVPPLLQELALSAATANKSG